MSQSQTISPRFHDSVELWSFPYILMLWLPLETTLSSSFLHLDVWAPKLAYSVMLRCYESWFFVNTLVTSWIMKATDMQNFMVWHSICDIYSRLFLLSLGIYWRCNEYLVDPGEGLMVWKHRFSYCCTLAATNNHP